MDFKIKIGDEFFVAKKYVDYINIYKIRSGRMEEVASYDLCYYNTTNTDDNVDIDIIIDILKSFKVDRLEIQRRYPNPAAR